MNRKILFSLLCSGIFLVSCQNETHNPYPREKLIVEVPNKEVITTDSSLIEEDDDDFVDIDCNVDYDLSLIESANENISNWGDLSHITYSSTIGNANTYNWTGLGNTGTYNVGISNRSFRNYTEIADDSAEDYAPGTIYDSNVTNEEYEKIVENDFLESKEEPLSTFSIDVDNAAYSNIRRMINYGNKPNPNAARIEEMLNYFNYDYPQPKDEHPFSIYTEMNECPWNKEHRLLHVGLQGETIDLEDAPASNLVFLLDVSGSMDNANKLPLVKQSLGLIVDKMRKKDRISIVVYAGAAGVVLPSTRGNNKKKILASLNDLLSGGSTAGGEGIELAYKIAKKNFISNGNNRIILCTDGDFNIGVSSTDDLSTLIEKKRKTGVALTVLGFGMGNYKDSQLEALADKGNGNYGYIDELNEAKKMLVNEMGGTFFTIAKDVKLQVEFNADYVESYRLIGYENRVLANKDFDDDTKDAGELGAGHSVTALYEVVLKEGTETSNDNSLRYQTSVSNAIKDELAFVKFRYKKPKGTKSILMSHIIENDSSKGIEAASDNFKFAAAVAEWGLLLRNSEYKANASYSSVFLLANDAKGKDKFGYREGFIDLIQRAEKLVEGVN